MTARTADVDLFGSLREHFSDGQLVEVTAAIALRTTVPDSTTHSG
jgi:hypothetical protein